jgi:hypothetical protein
VQRAAAAERRPVAAALKRHAPPVHAQPRTLPARLGNHATQALIARAIASPGRKPVEDARLPLKVSAPTDRAELEAEATARKVMRMREPPAAAPAPAPAPAPARPPDKKVETKPKALKEVPKEELEEKETAAKGSGATGSAAKEIVKKEIVKKEIVKKELAKSTVQRAAVSPASSSRQIASPVAASVGAPLPAPVRAHMEPRLGASFSNVRVHTGDAAARESAALNAHAFTVGQHIFFGRDKFQPQSAGGQELIAHELVHTIQQGAAVQHDVIQRSAAVPVVEHVTPHVQRGFFDWLDLPNPRDYFADKAANIPGYTMLTWVIGFDPIRGTRVERTAGNLLRAAIRIIPGGNLITSALDNHGVFDRVSEWASAQFDTLADIGTSIWNDIQNFIEGFRLRDLRDPGALWDRAKGIVERPIARIEAFAIALKDGIVELIKDAILMPIAEFAKTTRGYELLCTVLGYDPITGKGVPQGPEALLGGFLKFIGEEEIWNTMQQAKAIPRAFAWFNAALAALRGFLAQIPGLFVQAFKALEIADIIFIPRAFMKLAGVFGNFAVQFVSWGASAVWNLLEIVFDVVSPGALVYIKKTGAALQSILRNPLPFVRNLVRAAKLGFQNFAAGFLGHLKAGLIDWLTGSLPGIYIPAAFTLPEIAKFAFSVLGLSWANIRQKLVRATSETFVKALETGFDIVVTLVREGPGAAWDKIKEQLANLKDMVIGGIIDFVVDAVVKKAIPKLIAMFIPGAGFISAIISIYDTVMVFVNKIKRIVQVVRGFIDSIVAIAAGNVGAAAGRVENALAGVLSLAINFLAGFAGLGKVADKVMGVINKVRAPIDKALDWLVNWIVTAAKKLAKFAVQAGLPQDPKERLRLALDAAFSAAKRFGRGVTRVLLQPVLAGIKLRYGLKQIEAFERGGQWWVRASANPVEERNLQIVVIREDAQAPAPSTLEPMPVVPIEFLCNTLKYVEAVFKQQLSGQEAGLNTISVVDWEKNRAEYDKSGRGSGVPQEEVRELYRKDLAARGKTPDEIEAEMERLAALHEPDLVAGGFNVIGKLGSRYINSSIGSQWRTRVTLIKDEVAKLKEDKPKKRINVKLTVKAVTA